MVKLIHVCKDEKFIDMAIKIYSNLDLFENEFLCFSSSNTLKYIKNCSVIIMNDWSEIADYINKNSNYVVLHSLFQPYKFIKKLDSKIKIIWHMFGMDFYGDDTPFGIKRHVNINLYKPMTHKFVYCNLRKTLSRIKCFISFDKNFREYKKILKRINYFSPILFNERELVKIPNIKGFLSFNYFDKDDDVCLIDKGASNILLGNSAAITNNHLDVFKEIEKYIDLEKQNVIIPFSYPNKDKYKAFVKNKLSCVKNIKILDTYLPLQEYEKILNSCGFAVFGFIRQQATENISILLRMGVKIFFYKDCIVYKYLKEKGYYVYSIEDGLSHKSFSTQLTDEQKKHNRKLCEEERNYEVFINTLKNEYLSILE